MNILLAFNSNYYMAARVLLHSLLVHNREPITVFILYSSLTKQEIAQLQQDASDSGHCDIHPLKVSSDSFQDAPLHCKWISVETYYRLLAQELLPPEVERFLYLDVDMVVNGSLKNFYDTDFEDKLLIACNTKKAGEIAPSLLEQRSLPPDTVYFNAGVLLYNLKEQRKQIDPRIYHEYPALFYNRLTFGDQDVMNAVFYQQTKYADFRIYNLFETELEHKTKQQKEELIQNAVIFHFNGLGKPWRYQYRGDCADLFWRYAIDFPEYVDLLPGLRYAQQQYKIDCQHKKTQKAEEQTCK